MLTNSKCEREVYKDILLNRKRQSRLQHWVLLSTVCLHIVSFAHAQAHVHPVLLTTGNTAAFWKKITKKSHSFSFLSEILITPPLRTHHNTQYVTRTFVPCLISVRTAMALPSCALHEHLSTPELVKAASLLCPAMCLLLSTHLSGTLGSFG